MKTGNLSTILLVSCCLVLFHSCGTKTAPPPVAGPDAAKLIVSGSASIIRDGGTIAIKTGDEIKTADELAVDADAQVDIVVGSDDVIRIKSNTTVQIENLKTPAGPGASPETEKAVKIQLKTGKVVAKLNTFKQSNSTFDVTTPACVAGIRGTQFSIESGSQQDEVNVLQGSVVVTAAGQEVTVGEKMTTRVRPGRPPMSPMALLEAVKPLLSMEVALMRPDLTLKAVRTNVAVFDLATVQRTIEYFQASSERLPETLAEAGVKATDSWDNPLIYYLNDTKTGYTLYSAGADGIISTSDDLQLTK